MSETSDRENQPKQQGPPPAGNPAVRALLAILVPLAAALAIGIVTGSLAPRAEWAARPSAAPLFAALGVVSWLLGLRWYGIQGLGLRGGRPLFAGIGFAVLGWVALLIVRWLPGIPSVTFNEAGQAILESTLLIEVVSIQSAGAGRVFIYLLLFEAFATQLWAFGTAFRSLADWRGPLSAAVISGLLFGVVGFLLFRESLVPDWSALLYFLSWGVLYGIIRLRTGSILGMVLVQALQSFTVWFVFEPPADPNLATLRSAYLLITALYGIIIWRLWPREQSDYRV